MDVDEYLDDARDETKRNGIRVRVVGSDISLSMRVTDHT